MNFKQEFVRVFNLWLADLDEAGDVLQYGIVKAVYSAFLKCYDES